MSNESYASELPALPRWKHIAVLMPGLRKVGVGSWDVLNGLDLFSGYGGAHDALQGFVRPIAYCEVERGAQRILLRRMRKGQIAEAPIWDDVRTLRRRHIAAPIDIITGGFPCQDISSAGTRRGIEGKRSGLFFEIIRLISEFRPHYLFLENVPAITVRGLDRILLDLASLGYDARWSVVSAAEMGAPHLRERIWILAYANSFGGGIESVSKSWRESPSNLKHAGTQIHSDAQGVGCGQGGSPCARAWDAEIDCDGGSIYPNTLREGQQRWMDAQEAWQTFSLGGGGGGGSWPLWLPQPAVCRGTYGPSDRRDRIRALGNGWVPQTAREAFMRLIGLKEYNKIPASDCVSSVLGGGR